LATAHQQLRTPEQQCDGGAQSDYPILPAHEKSQMGTEAYTTMKQLHKVHAKVQKLAVELNKHQRVLLALGNEEVDF
jgi:hypothetical protein